SRASTRARFPTTGSAHSPAAAFVSNATSAATRPARYSPHTHPEAASITDLIHVNSEPARFARLSATRYAFRHPITLPLPSRLVMSRLRAFVPLLVLIAIGVAVGASGMLQHLAPSHLM